MRSTPICGRIRSPCLSAEDAAPDFHARFDATSRSYIYRIVNRRPDLTLDRGRAWRVAAALDADAMHAAAQALVGRHDFSTFRYMHCQADTPVKTLDCIRVFAPGRRDHYRHQRRAPSCTSRCARWSARWSKWGAGARHVHWIGDILKAADRTLCGPVAPPDGLYLAAVSVMSHDASAGRGALSGS